MTDKKSMLDPKTATTTYYVMYDNKEILFTSSSLSLANNYKDKLLKTNDITKYELSIIKVFPGGAGEVVGKKIKPALVDAVKSLKKQGKL